MSNCLSLENAASASGVAWDQQKGCRRMVIGTRGKLVNCVRQGGLFGRWEEMGEADDTIAVRFAAFHIFPLCRAY